jgi:hypothetical protein
MGINKYARVISCSPKGKILQIDDEQLKLLVDNCIKSVSSLKSPKQRAIRLINMAETCYDCQHLNHALRLFQMAYDEIEESIDYENIEPFFRSKDVLFTAARGLDRILNRVRGRNRHNREQLKAFYLYLSVYDDYNYCFHGIDNEFRFNTVSRIAKKLGV